MNSVFCVLLPLIATTDGHVPIHSHVHVLEMLGTPKASISSWPHLKPLLARIPADPEIEGLDAPVLDQLASKSRPSFEAVDFVCPLKPLRQFEDAEITNQDVINQSAVLVNGARIVLDRQQVE